MRGLCGFALVVLLACAPSAGSCPAPALTVRGAPFRAATQVQVVGADEVLNIAGSDWGSGCGDSPGCVHRSREPYSQITVGVVRAEGDVSDVQAWRAIGRVKELGTVRPSDDLSFSLDEPVALRHPGMYMLVATSPLGEDIPYGWMEAR